MNFKRKDGRARHAFHGMHETILNRRNLWKGYKSGWGRCWWRRWCCCHWQWPRPWRRRKRSRRRQWQQVQILATTSVWHFQTEQNGSVPLQKLRLTALPGTKWALFTKSVTIKTTMLTQKTDICTSVKTFLWIRPPVSFLQPVIMIWPWSWTRRITRQK